MGKLLSETPEIDLSVGETRLRSVDLGRLTWLAPWPGAEAAMGEALTAHHGVPWPAPNTAHTGDGAEILWHGRAQALLIGAAPALALAEHGGVLDVSDGWAAFRLTGPGTADALARLVPVDLRPFRFAPGATVRTMLGHMSAQIVARAEGADLLVMASMAETAAHELARAARGVAARAALLR